MGREHDEQFEWVNAWAALTKAEAASVEAATVAVAAAVNAPVAAPVASKPPEDQLMRDIIEIERARDALAALPLQSSKRRVQALTLVPSRSDPVPVVVGGVLALVMLTVFGAAAAMTKLGR